MEEGEEEEREEEEEQSLLHGKTKRSKTGR